MTRRKPVDLSIEDWTERLIREAQERGEFDGLAGAGKPIPDLDRPWSAERWVADLARREGVDLAAALPAPLRLRRDRERLLARLPAMTSEQLVRAAVDELNDAVREAFRRPTTGGPPMTVGLMDHDVVLHRWRTERTVQPPDADVAPVAEPQPRAPWWQRWGTGPR